VLHATGAKAYRFVKRLFALPSIELIYKSMSAIIKFNEDILLAMENIPRAMERWPYQWDIAPNEIVHVVLVGDAAVFNPEMLPQFPYPKPSELIVLHSKSTDGFGAGWPLISALVWHRATIVGYQHFSLLSVQSAEIGTDSRIGTPWLSGQ
jgi:hypothetical protein